MFILNSLKGMKRGPRFSSKNHFQICLLLLRVILDRITNESKSSNLHCCRVFFNENYSVLQRIIPYQQQYLSKDYYLFIRKIINLQEYFTRDKYLLTTMVSVVDFLKLTIFLLFLIISTGMFDTEYYYLTSIFHTG